MGSLFGVWVLGGIFRLLQPYLGIARWFHIPVVMGVAVLIGAGFCPELLAQLDSWAVTLGAMLVTTALATAAGMIWLVRVRRLSGDRSVLKLGPWRSG